MQLDFEPRAMVALRSLAANPRTEGEVRRAIEQLRMERVEQLLDSNRLTLVGHGAASSLFAYRMSGPFRIVIRKRDNSWSIADIVHRDNLPSGNAKS